MDPDVILTLLVVSVPISCALGFGWYLAARDLRRLRAEPPRDLPDTGRIERLERTLEGLAAQNERLAEAQDFLGRVLADRLVLGSPHEAGPAREITPH